MRAWHHPLVGRGTHGDQANVDVIWPGDLDATMTRNGEVVDDGNGSYTGVGGLPAAIVAGLSLGPSGFPLFASDTGGYRHSPPSPETFVRWCEYSALMPVMQIGTSTNDVAWEFGDDAVLDAYRELTRLHLRLFPYFWTHIQALSDADGGRAIARPLGLAFPELGVHPSFDYMLGDALLVAPVIDAGAVTRLVNFPPGRWIHWWTGQVIDAAGPGVTTQMIDAPLGRPPLFLRAGQLVPMLRPTIDSLAPTTMPGTDPGQVDSYASAPGRLTVRTSAGPSASLTLFDQTSLSQAQAQDAIELSVTPGSEFVVGVSFELVGVDAAPAGVSDQLGELPQLDAAALLDAERGWAWGAGVLHIKLEAGAHAVVVQL